ncbi:MAG TPA: Mur ligase family protein [Xanthomonadales bacterium]|nr:Mur ligase family protein [Xanthomonadales bacterium]
MKKLEIIATWGPSRRARVTVVELLIEFEAVERKQLGRILQELQNKLPEKLQTLGLEPPVGDGSTDEVERLAGFINHTALALQRKAGFDVQFEGFLSVAGQQGAQERFRTLFEHDDASTGVYAADLALCILADACPLLAWQPEHHEPAVPLEVHVAALVEVARRLVASPDTAALADAARKRGIPVIRLEREPYGPVQAEFRVAPNSLIMLGQSRYQLVLDGLFCIGRPGSGFSLMKDRRLIWRMAASAGIPTPSKDMDLLLCTSASRARRVARRIGYPLRLWPVQRDPEAPEGFPVEDEAELAALFDRPNIRNRACLLEPVATGPTLELLFANGQLLRAKQGGAVTTVDSAALELAERLVQAVNSGLLLLRFDTDSGLTLNHLDPAPSLWRVLAGQDELRKQALNGFLDWLFPAGTPNRIPIIAITGTNGKTTTSTMISRITQAAGHKVGMAQTNGVYFNGEMQEFGDLSAFMGHCKVFENREVDFAVLETARGGLVSLGFTFDRCEVAVCTNVTADHLGQLGIDTVEQMAEVKRSLLERADTAAVLNGDDALCVGMLPHLSGKTIWLSTLQDSPQGLRSRTQADINVVNVEEFEGKRRIVLHEFVNGQSQSTPVIGVDDIPATFRGHAPHNISNALHAIAAARAAGLPFDAIVRAMGVFEMSFESLPGRLNMHDNGRYHVIMDYAHNADGIRQLVRFTDRFPCPGRKILRFGVSPEASESATLAVAAAAAGHFDCYVCSGKPGAEDTETNHAAILKQGLMDNGVDAELITVTTNADESFDYPVSLCRQGDLLVLVTSRTTLEKTWKKILATQ